MDKMKVALIGLDTSHAVEFPRWMQDPAVPAALRGRDLCATRCLRFETPFQDRKGLDERQAYLERIGVMVTEEFDAAVADCDALMIEINDPARHLEYFEKCAGLGLPIFLDKPFADTPENARRIMRIAEKNNVRFFTSSALRFDADLEEAVSQKVSPASTVVWGPVGRAAAGSSIVWYGVHAFEMRQRIMGRGALSVLTSEDGNGYVCHVAYAENRRGIVELTRNCWNYGGIIRDNGEHELHFRVSNRIPFYRMLLAEIAGFFRGQRRGVPPEDSLEVMSMLAAADRSARSRRAEPVFPG